MKPEELVEAFNNGVEAVDSLADGFILSGDPKSTQDLRKAVRRLRTPYSLLPKKLRMEGRARRYLRATKKLSRATGELRDLDTITSWASQVPDPSYRRSFTTDLVKLRTTSLRATLRKASELKKMEMPSVDEGDLHESQLGRRIDKIEGRLVRRVDEEFGEFLSTQEVELMHALRKDSKRLRHFFELVRNEAHGILVERLRSIQDELGAIRDNDLVIEYLSGRQRLTTTRALIREEMARRHARLEDFVTKNRGQGRVVPVLVKASDRTSDHSF